MKYSILFFICIILSGCSKRHQPLTNNEIIKEKYAFLKNYELYENDRNPNKYHLLYPLADSLRLPEFKATLYMYRSLGNWEDCYQVIKMDSSSECILIPAKEITSRELSVPFRIYGRYDFDFCFLQKYMNDHREEFRDIHKFKDDFKKIFVNNFYIKGSWGWHISNYSDFLNGDGDLDSITKGIWNKNGLDGFMFNCGPAQYCVMVPVNANDSVLESPIIIRVILKWGIMRM
jgi:hypothetical protein